MIESFSLGLLYTLVFFSSFLISFVVVPTLIRTAKYKQLFDNVDERKVHKRQIPRLGGVAVFAGMILSLLMFSLDTKINAFLAGLVILFFIGLKDDLLIISPLTKFVGQTAAVSVLVLFGGLLITDLHGFFGITKIPEIVGFLLTLFTFLVTINAINFIDGIDGLASTIGILAASVFGLWFYQTNNYNDLIIALTLIATLLAFLPYNFHKADKKIFLGDTGSMLIGYTLAFLAIEFNEKMLLMTPGDKYFIYPAPAVAFGFLLIPYFDMIRVIYIRLILGKSPFFPDKNHLHHLFLRLGFSHKQISLTYFFTSLLIDIFVIKMSDFMSIRRLILVELLLVMFLSFILEWLVRRNRKV